MKKIIATASVLVMAGAAMSAITGTSHDLSTGSGEAAQICIYCHTPHNATTAMAPLWNRNNSAATYTVYNSNTLDATMGQPTGSTVLCLSCHDGTVATNSTHNNGLLGDGVTSDYISAPSSALIGTDLSNDHPVSFTYDNTLFLADGGLNDPGVASVGNLLEAGKVECASCHDVHDNTNGTFLVMSNDNSALCLTCHAK